MKKNTLYYGDCLDVMGKWDDNSVDLIYLDPPFNSKANYNILFGTQRDGGDKNDLAQLTAFTDTWEWDGDAEKRVDLINSAIAHPAHRAIRAFSEIYPDGSGMLSYLSYMAERIAAMHRLLKDTGTIYLHCDPTASHYLKIIMDEVFGKQNFRNEIVWSYPASPSTTTKDFPRKHDTIFRFVKTQEFIFNHIDVAIPYSDASINRSKYAAKASTVLAGTAIKLRDSGKIPPTVWQDIQQTYRYRKEHLGYPTQKPLALLKRIVKASSNEGDLVLDPFCGCGTTVEAAHSLKRDWIGIDISSYAIEVVRRERMKDLRIDLAGVPKDLKGAMDFSRRNPFDFEKWAVTRIPGFAPNAVQRGDGGIDGRALIFGAEKERNLCIAQVKGGKQSIDSLRTFFGMIASGKAAIGVFITLEKWDTPSVKKCIAQAGTLQVGTKEYSRLIMYTIDDHFHGVEPKIPPLAHPRTGQAFQAELAGQSRSFFQHQ
ncbi:DNA methyltransferase [Candidatus Spongiihabitans sp.]|uniref:DNA methyltransferase n=1 Tax=Candidatus Spongiihabitans sp. TaxID=3101308 RepID=UPI003C6F2449